MKLALAAVIQHFDDVGVIELAGSGGLAAETRQEPRIAGQMGVKELDGHRPAVRRQAAVDLRRRALAQPLDQLVGATGCKEQVRHG